MDAADHIQHNRQSYQFEKCMVPRGLNDTACQFGWAVYFAGGRAHFPMSFEADRLGFAPGGYVTYAAQMDSSHGWHWPFGPRYFVARRMRKYARKFYRPPVPEVPAQTIPQMLAPFRGKKPNWALMRDKEGALDKFRQRLGLGIGMVLARPLKEGSHAGL